MSPETFIDLYEILQVSPNADTETIERVFRHLAKRFHPDHPDTGDSKRFQEILRAYRILTDPERRAAYDVFHQRHLEDGWKTARSAKDTSLYADARDIRGRILSLLYARRMRDPRHPGLGELQIGRLADCPEELLEFHLWYLRQRGYIERDEEGSLSITAEGVDRAESEEGSRPARPERLLTVGAPERQST